MYYKAALLEQWLSVFETIATLSVTVQANYSASWQCKMTFEMVQEESIKNILKLLKK